MLPKSIKSIEMDKPVVQEHQKDRQRDLLKIYEEVKAKDKDIEIQGNQKSIKSGEDSDRIDDAISEGHELISVPDQKNKQRKDMSIQGTVVFDGQLGSL